MGTAIDLNFLFLTNGSDGDVHPFVGLGRELMRRGHRVTLFANEHFDGLATRSGLGFVPIGTKELFQSALQDPAVWKSITGAKTLGRWMCDLMPAQYEGVINHLEERKTVIVASGAALGARLAHEKHGIPMASVVLQPAVVRSVCKMPIVAGLPALPEWVPPVAKRLLYWVVDRVADQFLCISEVNTYRATLGLGPIQSVAKEWWLSPQCVIALFPDWYGMPQPDWAPHIRTTGFPLYDDACKANKLTDDILEFLAAGDRPIVFTPGTAMMHGRLFFDAAVGACRLLGRRGLLLTRHTGQLPSTLPDSVRHISYAPFSDLLPRAAAIVHHGGVGTLAQALAAGIPQLVMPMAYDQPDNAARLKSLGVADSIKRSAFRAPAVAKKLRYLLESEDVAARCRALAQRIDRAQGLTETCHLLEELGNGNARSAAN